ncbi:hypothetical protein Acsp06_05010 [Actinomycetospora sp. NBRC 106375]|uniref:DUF4383 domain-containing protein n=1 Tax=Actinomycetospora sp. NBRC 106375 TaxID=3032207 RepID=UPI0024A4CF3A|nr:DUF4383 domain-containing protein [Actinomycetospora sp. NBRC 106375]GLZ44316.1 hypothetical protein Acsp06_05010 [Actinomycetospora sp. NBRC 106375]
MSPDAVRADHRVVWVHRVGAVVVAVVIAVFGALGFAGGLGFFDTDGAPVLGLSTNGALSTISLVTAVVLVAAAIRGGRASSTVMIVVGVLFLVSAFVNLWLIGTSANVLAFRLPNVFFSIAAGCVLLFTGAYGRISAGLPADNPYAHEGETDDDGPGVPEDADRQPRPASPAEAAADEAMAEAERAVAQGAADDGLRRRLAAADEARTHEERRAIWMRGEGTSA